jgi:hypothetical protein
MATIIETHIDGSTPAVLCHCAAIAHDQSAPLSFSAMTSQYFIVGMMPNLESFDGFSTQLLGNQLCALGLSDG